MMKFIFTILLTVIALFGSTAQQVIIKEQKQKIEGDKQDGYVSTIYGEDNEIESQWYKSLRTLGRLREVGLFLTVKEAELPDWEGKTIPVYSKLTQADSSTRVWVGIKIDSMQGDSLQMANEKLRVHLYEFSLSYYKEQAQEKVDEAERAVAFTEKKLTKLKAEEVELGKDLEDKKEEIERLKQLVEKNLLEEQVVAQKIIDNKAYQDSTVIDIDRLKQVVAKKKASKAAIE